MILDHFPWREKKILHKYAQNYEMHLIKNWGQIQRSAGVHNTTQCHSTGHGTKSVPWYSNLTVAKVQSYMVQWCMAFRVLYRDGMDFWAHTATSMFLQVCIQYNTLYSQLNIWIIARLNWGSLILIKLSINWQKSYFHFQNDKHFLFAKPACLCLIGYYTAYL